MVNPDVELLLAEAGRRRSVAVARRRRLALMLPLAVIAVWLVGVGATSAWEQVARGWAGAATMTVGSFVAGSTPQGGGAVAFPVMTKGLGVTPEGARTFALGIQAIGMGTAAATIVVLRRTVDWAALSVAVPGGLVGFAAGLVVTWWWQVPPALVRTGFTALVAAAAVAMWLGSRRPIVERREAVGPLTPRLAVLLAGAGLAGGLASSFVGSGVDVLLFLALVGFGGVAPRVGIPTSVIAMAVVSVVGFIGLTVLGDGLGAAGAELPAMWLASVPVVVIGAPLGAWAVARVGDRSLTRFVTVLASVELLSTLLLVRQLRTDPAAMAWALLMASVLALVLGPMRRPLRRWIAAGGGPPTYTRGEVWCELEPA